jgi:O-antigen/teichoic acid export membrane protein
LIFDIGWPLARLVLTFLVLAGGGQLYAVVTANIVATGLAMGAMGITVYRLFYRELQDVTAVSPLRPLLEFSLPVMLFNIVILSQSQIEVYLLTALQSVEASGIFSAAARTSILIVAFLEGLGVIFSPVVADLSHRGRMADLKALTTTVTRWSFISGLPAALLIILFREPLLLLFGPDFVLAAPALVILSLGQLINAATGPVGIILTMSGQPRINLANSVLTLLLSIMLGIALIPRYGLVGAALGSSFSTSIVNVFRLVLVYKLLGIWAYNRQFVKPVIAAVIAIGITYTAVLRTNHDPANWWYSLPGILIFLVSYGACILLLKLDEADMIVMRMVRSRLTKSTQRAPEV